MSLKKPYSLIKIQSKLYMSLHKGRIIPLDLLEKVKNEINELIDDGQIIKLEKFPEDLFVSPVVITVKKDKSFKIAVDSKKNSMTHCTRTNTKSKVLTT